MDTTALAPSSEDIETYRRDGVVCLRGLVSAGWVERLRGAVDRVLATPAPHSKRLDDPAAGGRFEHAFRLREVDTDFAEFSMCGPLPSVAAALLESSRVNLFFDQFIVKEPGTAASTPWHNDQPYWPILGTKVITVWIALDPVDANNGRVEWVRGSHRENRWFQPQSFLKRAAIEGNEEFEAVPDVEANRAAYDIVAWDLAPGDLVAFQGLVLHGAGGNRSGATRRRGYIPRYTGDDVTYDPRPGTTPELRYDDLVAGQPITGIQYPLVWGAL